MKKNFKLYLIAWGVLLALFNVISFVIPNEHTAMFWIGYAFISLAFIGQLACSYKVFADGNTKKMFYKISLFRTSYIGLIVSFVGKSKISRIFPLINNFPWHILF